MQNWSTQPLPLLVFRLCRAVILWGGLGIVGTLIVVATIAIGMTPVPSLRGVTPPLPYSYDPAAYCHKGEWRKDPRTKKWFQEEHCLQESLDDVRGLARFLPVPDVKGP